MRGKLEDELDQLSQQINKIKNNHVQEIEETK